MPIQLNTYTTDNNYIRTQDTQQLNCNHALLGRHNGCLWLALQQTLLPNPNDRNNKSTNTNERQSQWMDLSNRISHSIHQKKLQAKAIAVHAWSLPRMPLKASMLDNNPAQSRKTSFMAQQNNSSPSSANLKGVFGLLTPSFGSASANANNSNNKQPKEDQRYLLHCLLLSIRDGLFNRSLALVKQLSKEVFKTKNINNSHAHNSQYAIIQRRLQECYAEALLRPDDDGHVICEALLERGMLLDQSLNESDKAMPTTVDIKGSLLPLAILYGQCMDDDKDRSCAKLPLLLASLLLGREQLVKRLLKSKKHGPLLVNGSWYGIPYVAWAAMRSIQANPNRTNTRQPHQGIQEVHRITHNVQNSIHCRELAEYSPLPMHSRCPKETLAIVTDLIQAGAEPSAAFPHSCLQRLGIAKAICQFFSSPQINMTSLVSRGSVIRWIIQWLHQLPHPYNDNNSNVTDTEAIIDIVYAFEMAAAKGHLPVLVYLINRIQRWNIISSAKLCLQLPSVQHNTQMCISLLRAGIPAVQRVQRVYGYSRTRDKDYKSHIASTSVSTPTEHKNHNVGAAAPTENNWQSLLHVAAADGNVDLMALLLYFEHPIDLPDTLYQQTALHIAALSGQKNAYLFLLHKGADAERRDAKGISPRELAIANGIISPTSGDDHLFEQQNISSREWNTKDKEQNFLTHAKGNKATSIKQEAALLACQSYFQQDSRIRNLVDSDTTVSAKLVAEAKNIRKGKQQQLQNLFKMHGPGYEDANQRTVSEGVDSDGRTVGSMERALPSSSQTWSSSYFNTETKGGSPKKRLFSSLASLFKRPS